MHSSTIPVPQSDALLILHDCLELSIERRSESGSAEFYISVFLKNLFNANWDDRGKKRLDRRTVNTLFTSLGSYFQRFAKDKNSLYHPLFEMIKEAETKDVIEEGNEVEHFIYYPETQEILLKKLEEKAVLIEQLGIPYKDLFLALAYTYMEKYQFNVRRNPHQPLEKDHNNESKQKNQLHPLKENTSIQHNMDNIVQLPFKDARLEKKASIDSNVDNDTILIEPFLKNITSIFNQSIKYIRDFKHLPVVLNMIILEYLHNGFADHLKQLINTLLLDLKDSEPLASSLRQYPELKGFINFRNEPLLTVAIKKLNIKAIKIIYHASNFFPRATDHDIFIKLSAEDEKEYSSRSKLYEDVSDITGRALFNFEDYVRGALYLANPHIVAHYIPTSQCSLDEYLLRGQTLIKAIMNYDIEECKDILSKEFPLDYLNGIRASSIRFYRRNLLENFFYVAPLIPYHIEKYHMIYLLLIQRIKPHVILEHILQFLSAKRLSMSESDFYLSELIKIKQLSKESVKKIFVMCIEQHIFLHKSMQHLLETYELDFNALLKNSENFFGRLSSSFHNEKFSSQALSMLTTLIDHKIDVTLYHTKPALLQIIDNNSLIHSDCGRDILRAFLKVGANPNDFYQNKTVFHHFVMRTMTTHSWQDAEGMENSKKIMDLMLEYKANIHLGKYENSNLLTNVLSSYRFQGCHTEILKKLLSSDKHIYDRFRALYYEAPSLTFWGNSMKSRLKRGLIKNMHDVLSHEEEKASYGEKNTKTRIALDKLFDEIQHGCFSKTAGLFV